MSKPKNMTPEQESAWKLLRHNKYKAYIESRPPDPERDQRRRDRSRALRKENLEKFRAKDREKNHKRRLKNIEKVREVERMASIKRRKKNPKKYREIGKKWSVKNIVYLKAKFKKNVEIINIAYVAHLLKLKQGAIPTDLFLAKREQIEILRELKPTKRTKHNAQEPQQPATSPR